MENPIYLVLLVLLGYVIVYAILLPCMAADWVIAGYGRAATWGHLAWSVGITFAILLVISHGLLKPGRYLALQFRS